MAKRAKAAIEVAFWAAEVRAERHEMHHEGRQAEEEQPSAFAHWGQVEDKLIDMADTLRRARARIAAARTACGCEAEVADKLKPHLDLWRSIGCPPRERRWIEEGVRFELVCDESEIIKEEVDNAKGADSMALWVTLLLEELTVLGVVEEVDDKPHIINALNVVPKANGKYRIILDLRPFNKYMKALKFSMETIQRIRPLIKQGDYMCAIDLRSAYHHLMVHPDHRRFCGFKWGVRSDPRSATGVRPRYFLFIALAFGSTQAPFVFQNVIWVVARFIRRKWGWRMSCYVDDTALFCQDQVMAEERGAAVAALLEALGFVLNRAKSIGIPGAQQARATQSMKLLGVWIETNSHYFHVPRSRVEKLRRAGHQLQALALEAHEQGQLAEVPVRLLARFAGLILSTYVAVGTVTRLMSRGLYATIAEATGLDAQACPLLLKAAWWGTAQLTAAACVEIDFWLDCIGRLARQGCPIRAVPPLEAVLVVSDASDVAVGCYTQLSPSAQIQIGQECLEMGEEDASSTYRELVGALRSITMFHSDKVDIDINLIIDNQGATRILSIGSRVEALQRVAAELFLWAVARGIRIFARWQPRECKEVDLCDWLSKLVDETAWSVDPELFKILDADPQFGGEQGHQVDLFAAEGNTQLDRFFSRFWCRRAEAADAFAQDWLGLNGWANPPRVLIPRVVAHARMCECSCTLIVPRDTTAMWWPLVAAPEMRPDVLPPGVQAVRDFDAYHGIVRADGELPRRPSRAGLRAVRLDFTDWRWRNGGARPIAWVDALLGVGDEELARHGLKSTAGQASHFVEAALRGAATTWRRDEQTPAAAARAAVGADELQVRRPAAAAVTAAGGRSAGESHRDVLARTTTRSN